MSYQTYLPLIMLAVCYAFVAMSAILDGCLRSCGWYKKHEDIKEKERSEKLQEALENSKGEKVVPTDLDIGEKRSCHNIEPHYFFIWFAIIALAATFLESANALATFNISIIGSRTFLVLGIPLVFHSFGMIVVLIGKISGVRAGHYVECLKNQPRQPIDEEGKRFVVFSAGLEGQKKIILDTERLLKPSIREAEDTKYENCRYDLDFGDAYLRFCYEKLLNLITFTLWNKMKGKYYREWLDKHIRFVGEPPEVGRNYFEYHQAQPSMVTYVRVCPLFATIAGAVCAKYILFKEKVQSMRLGGVKMTLKENFGMGAWTKLYLTTCCGFQERFDEELDNNIIFTGQVNTNRTQEYTRSAYRTAHTQSATSASQGDVEMQRTVKSPMTREEQQDQQSTQESVTDTSAIGEQEQMENPIRTAYHPQPATSGEPKE